MEGHLPAYILLIYLLLSLLFNTLNVYLHFIVFVPFSSNMIAVITTHKICHALYSHIMYLLAICTFNYR